SEWLRAEIHRNDGKYVQEYERGKKKYNVKRVSASKLHGTIITFKPDEQIFSETKYSWDRLVNHLRGQAYLVKSLRIRLIDARGYEGKIDLDKIFWLRDLGLPVPSKTFFFEGGLLSLIKFYNQKEKPLHREIFYADKEQNGVFVEIALQYVDDIDVKEISYTNNTVTPEGGMHVTGFRTALTRLLNDYAKKNNVLKDSDGGLTGDDVREGLVAVISVKLLNPQFEGQTKTKLGSVEARSAVDAVFSEMFSAFLEEHPDDAKAIINKGILALKARKAAKAAKDSIIRKGALEGMTLPGKLADCQSRDPEESEIFIVEGDSAGGSGKQGRDRRIQAVLPLKGKILNVEKARLDRMMAFAEIRSLIIAMGVGIGDMMDLTKLRYHKIIIATDADVDGAHIATLLLTFFFRYYRELIEQGKIFIAQPPLYKIKKGREFFYAYNDEEKNKIIKELGGLTGEVEEGEAEEVEPEMAVEGEEDKEESSAKTRTAKISIQRYKGLGEMNPEELWETTLNPETRVLKQVAIHDFDDADKTFDTLMGNEVGPRKLFIQTHAKTANLDI
ncbi:MAG TPA: toprim domain-containing protein, partial [Candidatus Paceibacterota bacterium]|nr:toprim domain-containing protein [Candidatus Paceibacterota bacterium]